MKEFAPGHSHLKLRSASTDFATQVYSIWCAGAMVATSLCQRPSCLVLGEKNDGMEDHAPQRKLAAILIADAVGFSRQMGGDEERALRVLKERRAAVEAMVASHGGRVFGGAGDSVVAEFHSAVDALKAAVGMQRAIADLNDVCPQTERMLFRIG